MARDRALAVSVGPGRAFLRLYRWSEPTISFGRNEPARKRYRIEAIEAAGVGLVRRPTGGRAVLHDRELTYAVALPVRALGGVRRTYAAINRALGRGLASMGVPLKIAETGERGAPGVDAGPCFAEPAPGELVAVGRKLVGSAQVKLGDTVLQHGSILVENDQCRLDDWTVRDGDRAQTRATSLAELLGRAPSVSEVGRAVAAGFEAEFGPLETVREEEALEEREIARFEEEYRSDSWMWRR